MKKFAVYITISFPEVTREKIHLEKFQAEGLSPTDVLREQRERICSVMEDENDGFFCSYDVGNENQSSSVILSSKLLRSGKVEIFVCKWSDL